MCYGWSAILLNMQRLRFVNAKKSVKILKTNTNTRKPIFSMLFWIVINIHILYFKYYCPLHANLGWSPTTTRQWQAIRAQRAGRVQSRYTLLALVAAITFASTFARRSGIAARTLLATWSLLAGYAIGALFLLAPVIPKTVVIWHTHRVRNTNTVTHWDTFIHVRGKGSQ